MDEGQDGRMEEVEMMEGESGEEEEEGGEENGPLQCDLSAYKLFHEGSTGAPCLSFDILRDSLGDERTCERPVTLYFTAGTQASRVHLNSVIVMKIGKLSKTRDEDDDDDDSELEDDEDEGREPVISSAAYKHNGGVNRIRATSINNVPLAASWSELGQVSLWDLSSLLAMVEDGGGRTRQEGPTAIHQPPMFSFRGHKGEGFALDWSRTSPGTLASGDCSGMIHVWRPGEGGVWGVGGHALTTHKASVEDLQWSPNEVNVLASCSVDKSIRVWDIRAPPSKACMITVGSAHSSDVNVINWNANEPFLASGGDDKCVRVWDLRKMQDRGSAVAELQHHTAPVSTVEWHPTEGSVLASGGEDDTILQWDLAVEKVEQQQQQQSEEEEAEQQEDENVPDQLLFIHKGQQEVKELHWHPQVPGLLVSTALSGFNVFKTISC